MTSIPVGTCWISRNNLKSHYLKKQKTFSGLFLAFLKYALNQDILKKKMIFLAHWIPNGVLKQDLLDIYVTTSFGINNFGNN